MPVMLRKRFSWTALEPVSFRVREERDGDLDEMHAFLLQELFLLLSADAADVAGFGDAVVDLQGLLGKMATDIVEIFLDEISHLPPS